MPNLHDLYLSLASQWWEECPACENTVPWKGCDDCGGTNKVWPMRRPCKGGHAIIQTNGKDSAGVRGARCEEVGCPGWLPVEDMVTLHRELAEATYAPYTGLKILFSYYRYPGGDFVECELGLRIGGRSIWLAHRRGATDEEALVNAVIEWVKEKR